MKSKAARQAAGMKLERSLLPGRNALGQWAKGTCGCPEKMLKPGHPYRYLPGQSGNPLGRSKARTQFEAAFYEALLGQGGPDEAARLLWDCARAKEPWAVQLLLQRLAPQDSKVKLEVSRGQDDLDYSRLSDEQLRQLDAILEQASVQSLPLASGEMPA
jgi:hypothetical protein